MAEPDLRPSPWPLHGVTVAILVIAYGVLAWGAWPASRPPSTGKLQEGLSVLEAVGDGAVAGAILSGGLVVLSYVAVSTAAVGWLRNPWLVHGVLLSAGALAILIASVV